MRKDIPKDPEFNSDDLNENEMFVLNYVNRKPKVSDSKLANLINDSEHEVNRILSSLKEKKFIERIGSDKSGHWHLLPKGKKK